MRRFYYLLSLMMLALAPMALTGCCDDSDDWYYDYDWYDRPYNDGSDDLVTMAQMLNGTWTGTLVNEYTGDDGKRYQAQMYVDFSFVQYTARSNNGNGYETDYVPATDKYGSPLYDNNGNQVYDSQTLQFKWYIDPRTYNIYVEYNSGARYVLDARGNSETSGFSLDNRDFNGVMEGVNNDEFVFFDCQRVTKSSAAARAKNTVHQLTFGSAKGLQRVKEGVPTTLRRR